MSDERLRNAERTFRSEPTCETALAWTLARRRAGEEGIEGFRIVRFVKVGYQRGSVRLGLRNLEIEGEPCDHCGATGITKNGNNQDSDCWRCDGMGVRTGVDFLQIKEVNKILDRLSGGFLVGRWKRTKSNLLRWLGP